MLGLTWMPSTRSSLAMLRVVLRVQRSPPMGSPATNGGGEAAAGGVGADELCYTKPSKDLEPLESAHEGYTGNAGNTVEHWYHRAAVVLWPRVLTFDIRAKAAPLWGIREVAQALEAGNPAEALALARRLLPL